MRGSAASCHGARWLICTIAALSLLLLRATAQTKPDIGNEYSITTLDVPKGASFDAGDGKLWFLRNDELIRLDPDQNRLISVPIAKVKARSWSVSGGSLWIFAKSKKSWAIRRIDPLTGKLIDTISLEDNRDQQFVYAYGSIWVWTGFVLAKHKPVLRIDPETKRVIEVSDGFKGQLLAIDGKIWMLGVENGEVKCLDPESNKIVDELSVGREHDNGILKARFKGGSYSYGIGAGVLWVLDTQETYGLFTNVALEGPRVKGILSGYNLKTHERIARIETDDALWSPAIWNGYVWLSKRGDPRSGHYISTIDPNIQHALGQLFLPISSKANREAQFLPPILTHRKILSGLSAATGSQKIPHWSYAESSSTKQVSAMTAKPRTGPSGAASKILLVGSMLILSLAMPTNLASQLEPTPDRSLSVIAIEGPKEKDVQAIAIGEGAAWVLTKDTLLRIDSGTGSISTLPAEGIKTWSRGFSNAAIGAGSLWVSREAHKIKGIHRIDLHSGKIVASIALHYRWGPVTFGQGFVWTIVGEETLTRIDPVSNQVSASIDLGKGYMQVKFGNGSVWTMGVESGTVKRIDPKLAKVVEEFSVGRAQDNGMLKGPIEGGLYFLTTADGMLWVADNKRMSNGKYVLSRYDPNSHEKLATIEADDSNGPPVIWNGAVWLSGIGYLTKVSVQTNHVAGRVLLSVSNGGRSIEGSLLTDGDTLWAIDSGLWAYSKMVISRIQAKVSDADTK